MIGRLYNSTTANLIIGLPPTIFINGHGFELPSHGTEEEDDQVLHQSGVRDP